MTINNNEHATAAEDRTSSPPPPCHNNGADEELREVFKGIFSDEEIRILGERNIRGGGVRLTPPTQPSSSPPQLGLVFRGKIGVKLTNKHFAPTCTCDECLRGGISIFFPADAAPNFDEILFIE